MNKLQEEYINACDISSDINEHIPFLFQLAKECQSIIEFGVRYGTSTRAFLYSSTPLKSYDLELNAELEEIRFSFDSMNLKTWFSGNIKTYHDCKFALPITEYDDSLDALLEVVMQEITEGFLIPNNLTP